MLDLIAVKACALAGDQVSEVPDGDCVHAAEVALAVRLEEPVHLPLGLHLACYGCGLYG